MSAITHGFENELTSLLNQNNQPVEFSMRE
jgi:hypothetical protein